MLLQREPLRKESIDPSFALQLKSTNPDNKVHGSNMEPIWGRQNPGGSNVGPMNLGIWEMIVGYLAHQIF